jgi:hypothetical protein
MIGPTAGGRREVAAEAPAARCLPARVFTGGASAR